MNNPTPAEIRALRLTHGLTQTKAAALIWCSLSAWEKWEAGQRTMCPAFWFAFNQKLEVK